jgi:hypothetical protein
MTSRRAPGVPNRVTEWSSSTCADTTWSPGAKAMESPSWLTSRAAARVAYGWGTPSTVARADRAATRSPATRKEGKIDTAMAPPGRDGGPST